MDLIRYFEQQQTKDIDRPRLRAGDVVRVETKIKETAKDGEEKIRLQNFEGTILGVRGSGPSATFTVRRETGRFAVERIFALYSPLITGIEIVQRQKVRRAKLNYLRDAGRRRVKQDELSMQRYVKEEGDKKRLAEDAKKRAEEAVRQAQAKEAAEAKAKEKAEADAKVAAEAPATPEPETPAETK